jgi:predicted transcriptional regulator of viral defense system
MIGNISPISIAQQLHQNDLFYFTPALLADLLNLGRRQTYRLIARLKDQGLVDEVEKGKYLLLGLEPERVLSNPLFIASHLVAPAYVSYWSALHYYGFTEQVPLTTFVATTKKKRAVQARAGGRWEGATAFEAALDGNLASTGQSNSSPNCTKKDHVLY